MDQSHQISLFAPLEVVILTCPSYGPEHSKFLCVRVDEQRVLMGEYKDNPSTSLNNGIERAITAVRRAYQNKDLEFYQYEQTNMYGANLWHLTPQLQMKNSDWQAATADFHLQRAIDALLASNLLDH